ncbi:SCP2 sterol-binding domain-containing protein [soil metagenome]|jgi:putative sterol carrier protein|nr:SCP2 sterol-binding domain-containing protein [Deinococcota bacterium]
MPTAKEFVYKLPQAFRSDVAGSTHATVQYDLSEPMYSVIEGGEMQVFEGRAENPDVTVAMSDEDFVLLMKGELNGMAAFMSGRLKVQGDMMLAQRLVSFVDADKLA